MWISRKKLEALRAEAKVLLEQLDKIKDYPYLIDIQHEGRSNRFIFMRGNRTVVVQTMSLISDDFSGWKKELLS